MSIETLILDVIHNRRKVFALLPLLRVISCIYAGVVTIRNWLYDRGLLKEIQVKGCVVSIGNIVCGGTGKTPFIRYLALALQDKIATAIITRGYRSEMGASFMPQKVSEGRGPLFSAFVCGDETYWLSANTACPVFAGSDKTLSTLKAIDEHAKVILVDDGMQHRKLHKDFEIVLIDASDPLGLGAFVPRGLLRDSPSRLRCAHLIVACNVKDAEHFEELKKQMGAFSQAPLLRIERVFSYRSNDRPANVGLFCGIAKPQLFENAVVSLGSFIVDRLILADHIAPTEMQLKEFARQCKLKGAQALVCTEKDFVKLSPNLALDVPIVVVRMELHCTEGSEIWEKIIENIIRKGKSFV